MKIAVQATGHDVPDFYNNAVGWHVDERGMLHVRKAVGNLASYAPARWAFVRECDA